jgi:predicted RNA-binding protein YlxR (DUF448 family)
VTSTTELVRVVALVDGTLAVGRSLHGRGAWLCAGSAGCFDLAVRRGAFARSFRRPISEAATAELRRSLGV